MSTEELTDKGAWILSNGFYGFWIPCLPYNTEKYQEAFRECLRSYEAEMNMYTYK